LGALKIGSNFPGKKLRIDFLKISMIAPLAVEQNGNFPQVRHGFGVISGNRGAELREEARSHLRTPRPLGWLATNASWKIATS